MITVCTVMTGRKYPVHEVVRIRDMIARHLSFDFRFICLTDQKELAPGIEFINIKRFNLQSWWAKMLVFNREIVGEDEKILYIDLDMVIAGSLDPLTALDVDFGICRNFTQINQARSGNVTWPCRYGSCVMLLGPKFGQHVWNFFWQDAWGWIEKARQFGDQWLVQEMIPDAMILQDLLPDGFFLHYKDFTETPDPDAHVLVFAGKTKPRDCQIQWIRKHWNLEV